jgi:cytochrome c biogenesis protein CcmG, thiol:disulfide interchange protein DsbE
MLPAIRQRYWVKISIAILSVGIVWIGLTSLLTPNGETGQLIAPRPGFLAPDFSLTALDGKTYQLSQQHGKVVVVNLWTTWCAYCNTEMPAFQQAYDSFQNSLDVSFLAINSTSQDTLTSVQAFVDQRRLSFPILLDTAGQAAHNYQIRALPTTFFIDRNGIVRNIVIGGPLTEAMIKSQVQSLLAGAQ